jgi:hypothetical protein
MPRLKALLISILFPLCTTSLAQVTPGQWVGDYYFVGKTLVDSEYNIHLKVPDFPESDDFPKSTTSFYFPLHSSGYWHNSGGYWHNGACYALGNKELLNQGDDFRRTREFIAKWQDGEWLFLGEVKADRDFFLATAIPCDNDRFIAIAVGDMMPSDGSSVSPFYKMTIKQGSGEITIGAPIPHGMDELEKLMPPQAIFGFALTSSIVMTERHATLVNRYTGLYWVFSLEKATLVKAGTISKKLTPEVIADGIFPPILCVNPEKNGTVLISARDESSITSAKEVINSTLGMLLEQGMISKGLYDEAISKNLTEDIEIAGKIAKALEEWQEKNSFFEAEMAQVGATLNKKFAEDIIYKHPGITWYRIYPETGTIEKCVPPIGGASVMDVNNPLDAAESALWHPRPDGSVKMGAIEVKDKIEVKEIKDEKDEDGNKSDIEEDVL